MFRLLAEKPVAEYAITLPPDHYDLYARVSEDMERVEEYLAHTQLYINKRNPLVILLEVLAPNVYLDSIDYYYTIRSKLNEVCRAINGTSIERQGTLNQSSMLYGDSFNECRLVTIKDYPVQDLDSIDWFEEKALTVLDHPITELSIPTFMGDTAWVGAGEVVIDISLVGLAFKFREWARTFLHLDEHLRPDKERFIQHVLYKEAINSHMRIAWLNRLRGYMFGYELHDYRRIAPIMTIDYTYRVDKYLIALMEYFYKKTLRYEAMLSHMVTPYGDGWDIIELPSESMTRQVHWAINMQRIKMIEILVEFGYRRKTSSDLAPSLNRAYRAARELKVMDGGMGPERGKAFLDRFYMNVIKRL